jgi:hypothetical protein
VSFFRIPSPSGGAERAKKGRTWIFLLPKLIKKSAEMMRGCLEVSRKVHKKGIA